MSSRCSNECVGEAEVAVMGRDAQRCCAPHHEVRIRAGVTLRPHPEEGASAPVSKDGQGLGLPRMYRWLLAFHVIAVIAWMAGMLYLPRLFVYHCEAEP